MHDMARHRSTPVSLQLRLRWDGVFDEPAPRERPPRPFVVAKVSPPPQIQVPLFDWRRARVGRRWPKALVKFNKRTKLNREERAFKAEADRILRDHEAERPKHRSDCLPGGINEQRPCPWVSCKWHTAIEVNEVGSLRVSFPGMAMDEIPTTCALDVAGSEDHPMQTQGECMTTDAVGDLLNHVARNILRIEHNALDDLAYELAGDDPEELEIARKNIKAALTRMIKK